jgi:hypothetical protein
MATVVTVIPPFQVSHDGTVYGPGEKAEVPDAVAERWQAHGWVEKKAPAKKAPPK